MKKFLFIATVFTGFIACNSNNNNVPDHAIRDSVRNPATVQPDSEAIPQDMTIKKDSVVVPDSSQIQK